MSAIRKLLRTTKKPEYIPEITATEADVLREIEQFRIEQSLPAQETYWPKRVHQLQLLRFKRLLRELEPGEREACGTEVTDLGRKALGKFDAMIE